LIAARVGGKHVAVFVEPADALAIPPALQDVWLAVMVDVETNDLCCKMPNLVWYTPLVGLENRKVGYTSKALYSGKVVGEPWSRSGENSAFYGTFSL
jgi:hypothetical protein